MIILVENNGELVGHKLIETAYRYAKTTKDLDEGHAIFKRALPVIQRMIEDENKFCIGKGGGDQV